MSEFRKPTLESVINRIITLSKEDPDFNYRSQGFGGCSYLGRSTDEPTEGRPCIVGQALQDSGVPRDRLGLFEDDHASQVLHSLTSFRHIKDFQLMMDFADSVQEQQDNGIPWGQAVNSTIHLLPDTQ